MNVDAGVVTGVTALTTNAVTMGADASTIEHTGATSFTISSSGTDGSVNIESMNVKTGVVTGLTALTTTALTTDDITMGADASTIEHTGATSFTISSSGTDGSVNIESMNVDAGVVTGLTALTTRRRHDGSGRVDDEHTGATSFTISSSGTDGSVNIESMNVKTGVVTGLTALTTTALTAEAVTMGADASTIEHTGATSFTISSSGTDGSVNIESMNVKAGVVTVNNCADTDCDRTSEINKDRGQRDHGSTALDMSSGSSYVEVTDDGVDGPEVALTISNPVEGQIVIVKNLDAQGITINDNTDDKVAIGTKEAAMLVYDGSVWEPLSHSAKAGSRRLGATGSRSDIYSDKRLKTNVKTIANALDKLDQIRGVSFEYAAPAAVRNRMQVPTSLPEDGTKSIGVLAQEIEAVLPEVVSTDSQGYKAVQYANLGRVSHSGEQRAEDKDGTDGEGAGDEDETDGEGAGDEDGTDGEGAGDEDGTDEARDCGARGGNHCNPDLGHRPLSLGQEEA